MTDQNPNPLSATPDTDIAPGEVTDYTAVLMQHDKGRAQVEASRALAECVEAAS